MSSLKSVSMLLHCLTLHTPAEYSISRPSTLALRTCSHLGSKGPTTTVGTALPCISLLLHVVQGREKSVEFVRSDPDLTKELDSITRSTLAGEPHLLEDVGRDDESLEEDEMDGGWSEEWVDWRGQSGWWVKPQMHCPGKMMEMVAEADRFQRFFFSSRAQIGVGRGVLRSRVHCSRVCVCG